MGLGGIHPVRDCRNRISVPAWYVLAGQNNKTYKQLPLEINHMGLIGLLLSLYVYKAHLKRKHGLPSANNQMFSVTLLALPKLIRLTV